MLQLEHDILQADWSFKFGYLPGEYTFMSTWKKFQFRDTVARVTFREASLEWQAVEPHVMRKVRGQHG